MDTFNAYHGAQVVIKRETSNTGTGIIDIYSGGPGTGYASGTAIAVIGNNSTATGQFLNNNGMAVVAFDGLAGVWR